jgi:hypothetical protein
MIIFVRLINGGATMFRPVDARRISDEVFEIIDQSGEGDDETWEFAYMDRVRCVDHVFQDGSHGLVATSHA